MTNADNVFAGDGPRKYKSVFRLAILGHRDPPSSRGVLAPIRDQLQASHGLSKAARRFLLKIFQWPSSVGGSWLLLILQIQILENHDQQEQQKSNPGKINIHAFFPFGFNTTDTMPRCCRPQPIAARAIQTPFTRWQVLIVTSIGHLPFFASGRSLIPVSAIPLPHVSGETTPDPRGQVYI